MMGMNYNMAIKAIEDWKPTKKFGKENEYRDDLIHYLRDDLNKNSFLSLEKINISSEKGRSLADIAVNGKEIGIELKKDLNSKSKIDRLIGQIQTYEDEYNDIIIVLVGKTHANYLDDLHHRIEKNNRRGFSFNQPKIEVIDKGT